MSGWAADLTGRFVDDEVVASEPTFDCAAQRDGFDDCAVSGVGQCGAGLAHPVGRVTEYL